MANNRMRASIPGANAPPFHLTAEQIENTLNTISEVRSKLTAVYQEESSTLKKAFESIGLRVPDFPPPPTRPRFLLQEPPSQRPESSSGTPIGASSQRPESSSETPIGASSQRPESSSETPIGASSQRPESSSETPIGASSQRPESSSETPIGASSQKEPSPPQSPKPSTSSSNWMLKHQGPGSGLTELLENSGIYVSEAELTECNQLNIDMRKFGRLLLPVIFSKEALEKCTFSSQSKLNRPAFDDHVKNIFVDYVTKHARESGWKVVSKRSLLQSCNSKILTLSKKH